MPSLAIASGCLGFVRRLALFAVLSSLGCTPEQGPRTTSALPEFRAGAHRLGVVGLFRHGRLDREMWTVLAPDLTKPFGGLQCQAGYGSGLLDSDPETYAAFDRHIKEEGLSNEALAILVPYTQADLLVIFDAIDPRGGAGTTQRKDPTDLPGRPTPSGHAPKHGQGSGGAGYTLTASLFSVSERKLVARVDALDAKTLRAAAEELAGSLAGTLAGSSCVAWAWRSNEAAPKAAASAEAPAASDGSAGAPGE